FRLSGSISDLAEVFESPRLLRAGSPGMHPLHDLEGESVQTVRDAIGLDIDQRVTSNVAIAGTGQSAMRLPQVGEIAGLHRSSTQVGSQKIQSGVHVVCEGGKLLARRYRLAAIDAGLQRHHSVNETVRVGENGLKRSDAVG